MHQAMTTVPANAIWAGDRVDLSHLGFAAPMLVLASYDGPPRGEHLAPGFDVTHASAAACFDRAGLGLTLVVAPTSTARASVVYVADAGRLFKVVDAMDDAA